MVYMAMQPKVESSREVVSAFLSGEIDPERKPAIFEDDILLLAVARLEEADPDWVLGQLSNQAWPIELRVEILRLMLRQYPAGHAVLNREAPGLLRNMQQP
jgi:hypothetical protein